MVRYRINPTPPPATSLTTDQIVEAIKAAASAWMAADPKVVAIFDGTTSEHPVGGRNVVGFDANYASGVITYPLSGSYANAFDMILNSTNGWDWKPCHPPDEPCTDYASERLLDLQNVATHEWGHVFGLGHVEGELTMNPEAVTRVGLVSRYKNTLGLGDVLGIRELYPCSCPSPTIFSP